MTRQRARRGPWPERVYVGMGDKEVSGTRPKQAAARHAEADALMASYCHRLGDLLEGQVGGGSRVTCLRRSSGGWGLHILTWW